MVELGTKMMYIYVHVLGSRSFRREYFPLDIIPAANEIVEYLKISNIVLLDYHYSDEENESWQKFDIHGQEWYISFTLIDGRRSDFENGGYWGVAEETLDKQNEVR